MRSGPSLRQMRRPDRFYQKGLLLEAIIPYLFPPFYTIRSPKSNVGLDPAEIYNR